jgi:HrpA-like RNA helicase
MVKLLVMVPLQGPCCVLCVLPGTCPVALVLTAHACILVAPVQEEIEATCFSIAERLDEIRSSAKSGQEIPELLILPIYSQLPADLQVQ